MEETLSIKACSICGDIIAWDDTEPVVCCTCARTRRGACPDCGALAWQMMHVETRISSYTDGDGIAQREVGSVVFYRICQCGCTQRKERGGKWEAWE